MSTSLALSPRYESSLGQRWRALSTSGKMNALSRVQKHGLASVNVVRQYAESGVMGGLLGAAHVMLPHGLEIPIPNSQWKVPLESVVMVAGGLIAASAPSDNLSDDARNLGAAAASVWAFRKSFDFMATKRRAAGQLVGGKFGGEDDYCGDTLGAETERSLLDAVAQL